MSGDRLTRDLDGAMIGGVIAGIARRTGLDVTLLRLLAVIAILPTGGMAVPLYLAAWLIIPRPDQVSGEGEAPDGSGLRARLRPGEIGASMREASDAARRAADRVAEAAHLAGEAARTAADAARAAADAARNAAEEFSDIAHHPASSGNGRGGGDDAEAPRPGEVPVHERPTRPGGFTGQPSAAPAPAPDPAPSEQLSAMEQPATPPVEPDDPGGRREEA